MYNYDFPLSSKARTYLKFENIFLRTEQGIDFSSLPHLMHILRAIVDYLDLVDGSNSLKIELLKDLDRCDARLQYWQSKPESDTEAITHLREQTGIARQTLDNFTRQRTVLKDDPFIESVKPRFFTPSGINCFDTPLFEFWLHQSVEVKQNTVDKWLYELDCLRIPIMTVLYLWRLCAEYQEHVALQGFMQENADGCDLINIQYVEDLQVYPVVSGSQSRINVRFLPFVKGEPVGNIGFRIAYIKSTLQ